MGICNSSKEGTPDQNKNTKNSATIPQTNNLYKSPKPYSRNDTPISYRKAQSNNTYEQPKPYSRNNTSASSGHSLYKPPRPNSGNNRYDDSYGLTKTRPQTVVDKNIFTENDFKQMKEYYYNLLILIGGGKKTIGKGGQAKINKYFSPKFGKMVVEKVIDVKESTSDSLIDKEFMDKINLCKEAILLFTCDYPNVVKIYDFIDDPITIVMEYCDKGSLRSILDKGIDLPPLYKIFLIYSICDGLGYIHTKGIVHGDLKCDNILLSSEKKYYIGNKYYPIPKLADFGLSQINTNNQVAAGTLGFIAPEVYEGSGLNFKTDIFALGMVMFEILSGLRPLPSDPQLMLKYLDAKMIPCTKEVLRKAWETRNEVLLPGIKNAYCDAFYTIMIKCISDDPNKRPNILALYLIVRKLYNILLEVTKEKVKVYDESESFKH